MREIRFRYELLRGGAYCGLLKAVDRTPRIRCNSADRLKMLLTASFKPTAYTVDGDPVEIDWLNDEVRPVSIIDGVEEPWGVYGFAKPQENTEGPTKTVSVSAYDRGKLVEDSNSEGLIYFPRGMNYTDAVEQLLTAAGISTVFKTATGETLATAREDWKAGTSRLNIANQLLSEISYNPLYFDLSGAAVLEPATVPEAINIRHTLDTSDPDTRVVAGRFTKTRDFFSAPNVFVVNCDNPELGAALSATAVNDNPQSPMSTTRRGRRIARVVNVNNLPSQAAAQAYADRLCNEAMISGEVIQLETGLLPGWGVGDVVALIHEGEVSICVSQSWTADLCAGGHMTHVLKKVVYQLDV